jgi:(1->4)-alpha-D-glucan 1-alpha-D-glucosylmutase
VEQVLAGGGSDLPGARVDVVRRLNQLTAPVAAKAVEDTAFYRYSRLLSRNDVGFQPGRLAMPQDEFLAEAKVRARAWPNAMLTTATHDHKRGEDVRARLAVVSEIAGEWRQVVESWLAETASGRPDCIAADDAYSLFQTLVGAWPIDLAADDTAGLQQFAERIAGWREKSLREAKLRSSWAAPDRDYEAANQQWLQTLLDPAQSPVFLASLVAFVRRIVPAGAVNSLVQAALRCTLPGVPDLYQGAELWDLSLVDPDNRRPVDFDLRQQLLDTRSHDWRSGSTKLMLIADILRARWNYPELFTRGAIESLQLRGPRAHNILAFRRIGSSTSAYVAVMLHVAGPCCTLGVMPDAAWWRGTSVEVGGTWRLASDLFRDMPVFFQIDGNPAQ